jgi:membrane protease YdiL (CAAX protease family)
MARLPASGEPATEGQPGGRRTVVRGLLRFLRSPRPTEPHDAGAKWWASLKLLGIDFALLVPATGLAALAEWGIDGEAYTADEGLSPAEIVFLGVVFAPLLEELVFRLFLAPLRPGYLIIAGLGTAVFFVDDRLDVSELMLIAGAALIAMAVAAARSPEARDRLSRSWDRRFAWVFYGSAMAFGLVHVFNYDYGPIGADEVLLSPLLVAPQMVGATVLGYVRIRLGYWFAVANHAIFNAVLTVPGLLG